MEWRFLIKNTHGEKKLGPHWCFRESSSPQLVWGLWTLFCWLIALPPAWISRSPHHFLLLPPPQVFWTLSGCSGFEQTFQPASLKFCLALSSRQTHRWNRLYCTFHPASTFGQTLSRFLKAWWSYQVFFKRKTRERKQSYQLPSWFLQMYMSFSALRTLGAAHRFTYGSCFPEARNGWKEASSMNSVCSTTCDRIVIFYDNKHFIWLKLFYIKWFIMSSD